MSKYMQHFIPFLGIAIGLMLHMNTALAADNFKTLSARWWQWALSIPAAENPMTDTTGDACFTGQQGNLWFLAGFWGPSKTIKRVCTIPEGKALFFPIVNGINVNTPKCGQDNKNFTASRLLHDLAGSINGATKVTATIDGKAVSHRRVTSIFDAALPKKSVFSDACKYTVGIFSPAVNDGYYAQIDHLTKGKHTLHLQALAGKNVMQDIFYDLTVVPVRKN